MVTALERSQTRFDDDLRLAHVICDQVDSITTERFKALDLRVDTKPDLSPVTDADREAERVVRSQLSRTRPRDSVMGEEEATTGSGSRQWIVDPIDGTKNFVRGVPVWGTLLSLCVDTVPVLGVVSAPALQRRWWAGRGSGAWTGRSLASATQLHVSTVSSLSDAFLSTSELKAWQEIGKLEQMVQLQMSVWRNRAYGDFWSYMLLAEGGVDAVVEPSLQVYDMAALVPIVEEAGGHFTSMKGEPGPWHGSAIATNGLLHKHIMDFFAK